MSRAKAGADAAGLKGWTYAFIAELARTYGDVSKAASAAGVGRRDAYREREVNPAFADAWDEAVDDFKDRLAARMRQRAIFGDLEPLIRKGKRFGNIRRFDTTLQIFLARNGRPGEFNLAPGDTREAGDSARKLGSQICDAIDRWRGLVPAGPPEAPA